MENGNYYKIIFLCIAFGALLCLSSCDTADMLNYYSDENNYINASGIVDYINYNDDASILYLGFYDLTPDFDDNCFKIVGENVRIAKERGIDEKINLGDKIEFVTAPKYFGDGYVMPIVAITVNGELLVEYSEGLANFLEWLKD